MSRTLSLETEEQILSELKAINSSSSADTEKIRAQPSHTLYGGADRFKIDTFEKLAKIAQAFFKDYASSAEELGTAMGLSAENLNRDWFGQFSKADLDWLYLVLGEKLANTPLEDFRLDFEDGLGSLTETEEHKLAEQSAKYLSLAMKERAAPQFVGIRIKAMNSDANLRSLRTLDTFVSSFVSYADNALPQNFVITLPKVSCLTQVRSCVRALEQLELALKLPLGKIELELMCETPAFVQLLAAGKVSQLLESAGKRLRGVHFGCYDYTALLEITSSSERLKHPASDFARNSLQLALAGTGIWLADSITAKLPLPQFGKAGEQLTSAQLEQNRQSVWQGWQLHFNNVARSLYHGIYQGWDLHPAQIPARFAAHLLYFRTNRQGVLERLKVFKAQAGKSLVGGSFDDAATIRCLINFVVRAIHSGAITKAELSKSGLASVFENKSYSSVLGCLL